MVTDVAVGEDYETFAESRDATLFARFAAEVPAPFQPLAQAPNVRRTASSSLAPAPSLRAVPTLTTTMRLSIASGR